MDWQTVKEILNITNTFYEELAKDFSDTRHANWKGWFGLIPYMKSLKQKNKSIRILDLGCGNGRFYKFLSEHFDTEFEYSGYDNNTSLLSIAKSKFDPILFEQKDIIMQLENIDHESDVICAFGLTHHIPSDELRMKWFKTVAKELKPKMFIFTIWNFVSDSRFAGARKEATIGDKVITLEDPNDYFIGFSKSQQNRYFHKYSEDEVVKIQKMFKKATYSECSIYDADGHNNKLNRYYIFTKP